MAKQCQELCWTVATGRLEQGGVTYRREVSGAGQEYCGVVLGVELGLYGISDVEWCMGNACNVDLG